MKKTISIVLVFLTLITVITSCSSSNDTLPPPLNGSTTNNDYNNGTPPTAPPFYSFTLETQSFHIDFPLQEEKLTLVSENEIILTQVEPICNWHLENGVQTFQFTITGPIPNNLFYRVLVNSSILLPMNGLTYVLYLDAEPRYLTVYVEFFAAPWDTEEYRNEYVVCDIVSNFALDAALRTFFTNNIEPIIYAQQFIDLALIHDGVEQAPELLALSELFIEAVIEGFEADSLSMAFPFNSNYLRSLFSRYIFIFDQSHTAGWAGRYTVLIGTGGWGNGQDDWTIHLTLHEVAHTLGLGESLAEIFTKELLNADWYTNQCWIYTIYFEYPLLHAAGRADFFRAAFTSNHSFTRLWNQHFSSLIDYRQLSLARWTFYPTVIFPSIGIEEVTQFTQTDIDWIGFMVSDSFDLFHRYINYRDADARSQFNEYMGLLVEFGIYRQFPPVPAVNDSTIYLFSAMNFFYFCCCLYNFYSELN